MMLAARQFRLTPEECLAGVTRVAATALGLNDRGTLETGKRADIAVLEDDPLSVEPMKIKDIKVWGTVLGGVKHKAASNE